MLLSKQLIQSNSCSLICMYISNFNSICNLYALSVLTWLTKNLIVEIISVMNPVLLVWQPSRELTNDGLSRDTCPPLLHYFIVVDCLSLTQWVIVLQDKSDFHPPSMCTLEAPDRRLYWRNTNLLTSFDVNMCSLHPAHSWTCAV